MKRALGLIFVLFAATAVLADDPGQSIAVALRDARASIAARDFAKASDLLATAINAAPSIAAPADRDRALTALHFYAAVAASGMKDERSATAHLKEFWRLSPTSTSIDPAKFDPEFVALFKRASGGAQAGADNFDIYYPGSAQVSTSGRNEVEAVDLFGTRSEKKEWEAIATAEDREKFLDEFWRRRDPKPGTPANELRRAFLERLTFADSAFTTRTESGSHSGRGKVYILLGKPSLVRRRPIRREDVTGHNAIWTPDGSLINGTIEQWVYTREQLPVAIAKQSITYRFISQEGIGNSVLQTEDAYGAQVLDMLASGKMK